MKYVGRFNFIEIPRYHETIIQRLRRERAEKKAEALRVAKAEAKTRRRLVLEFIGWCFAIPSMLAVWYVLYVLVWAIYAG